MDNLSWGNPVAHRVRVHFNTASKKIYEGMPVCYNFDTTVNWAGGSVSDGAVTASTSLTAGSPATAAAKYLEVEEPSADNIQWFAGVVARGGWVGKTTSATAGVGQLLDIYVPNGAIVPVRTDSNCLIGQTILAITTGSQELGVPLATDSRPVAITEETYNRGTAGLVLAKLDPNLFLYQDHAGTPLSIDDADTGTNSIVNSISLSSLQTTGWCMALSITETTVTTSGHSEIYFGLTNTGTGAGGFHVLQICGCAEGTAIAGDINGIKTQVNLEAASALASATAAGIFSKVHVKASGGTHDGDVVAGRFALGLDTAVNGDTAMLHFEDQTVVAEFPDYFFIATSDTAVAMSAGGSLTPSHHLKILINDVGYNILLDAT